MDSVGADLMWDWILSVGKASPKTFFQSFIYRLNFSGLGLRRQRVRLQDCLSQGQFLRCFLDFGVFSPEAPEVVASDSGAFLLPFFFEDSFVSTVSSVSCVPTAASAFFERGLFRRFSAVFPFSSLFTRIFYEFTSQNANTMSSASSANPEANCIPLSLAPVQQAWWHNFAFMMTAM
jgi:hypothetical protein